MCLLKKTSNLPGEFELIARYFAPLAKGFPGAYGLLDDAAVITPLPGHELVAKTDASVGGIHFLNDDPPDLIARKALRVNLSDLAAKGVVTLSRLAGKPETGNDCSRRRVAGFPHWTGRGPGKRCPPGAS